jgi:hypothetical protein
MADVSSITGYGIHSAFSNYGGYAGASSTTSGVGGVGEYHHHHLNRASGPQDSGSQSTLPTSQSSDLLDILGATNQTGSHTAASIASGTGLGLLTGNSNSTLTAWLAGTGSPGRPSGGPGQILDTLA